MRQVFPIELTGRINRVDPPNKIEDGEVLFRENFIVIGTGTEKTNRKIPGADRFSDTDTGTSYVWGTRYYSINNLRKTFSFNNGRIYHIDDNGVESLLAPIFAPTAIPCHESMKVSSENVLYFSEGINTGMYSHDGNISNVFIKELSVTLNFVGLLGHLDRMFGFEEDSEDLYFSKNLDPTNFTDSTDAGVITIGPRRGAKIIAIKILYGTIYIIKQDSIWRLTGKSPAEFSVEEVHPYLGGVGRRTVQNTDKGIIFMGSDFEFYFFAGTVESTVLLTSKLLIGGDLTKNVLPIINRDMVDKFVSIYHNNTYRCSMVENGGVSNTIEYCFNTINKTDHITRSFNISCYIKWDRFPDKGELLTGRTDLGRLMKMNLGFNVDNGATSPSMPFKLQSKFVGSDEPRNIRFKRAFFGCRVWGAEPVKAFYSLDCRNTRSDFGSDEWPTRGENKNQTFINLSAQDAITGRVNLDYGKSKGQNISFLIDNNSRDVDFELSKIQVEGIVASTLKKSQKVAA